MRNILLIVVLGFCLGWGANAQQAANQFRRIDTEWGLSNNQINTIFADSKGFVWFATISGLNRYDGYSFHVFKNIPGNPTSLPENSIQEIFEDHLGYLWLLTNNAFYIYDAEKESFGFDHPLFKKNITLPRSNISSLRLDADSNVWISNDQMGLYYYDRKSDHLQRLINRPGDSGSLSSDRILDVAFCSKGYAYVMHYNGVVDVIDPKDLTVVKQIDFEVNPDIIASYQKLRLFIDSDDNLWLYAFKSGEGLYYFNQKDEKRVFFHPGSSTYPLSSGIISSVIEDNTGQIWVGTDHGGINLIDKETLQVQVVQSVPGDATSLSSNSITALCRTRDGIIWVGTFKKGVNYHHPELYQFQLYRSHPMLEDKYFSNDVNCFAEDARGNLWIGTNGDGLVYFNRKENTFTKYKNQPGNPHSLSNDVVVSLCVDHRGKLWAGTYQGGLNSFDGARFKHYKHDPDVASSLSDDRIWQIFEDSQQRLWIGTLGGGLELYDARTDGFIHHRVGDFNSIHSDYVLALTEDAEGNIWIGTSNGLNVLDAATQRFRHFAHEPIVEGTLSHENVLSVLEDAEGRLWVGTRNGLNLLDRETGLFKVFREEDGLPDHNIITMQGDAKGSVWMATLNGLSNLKVGTDLTDFDFRNYDVLDGLQGQEFNEHASLKTASGEMVFGGANGFNIFHPDEIIEHSHQFKVVLTDLKLHNRSVAIGERINNQVLLQKAISQSPIIALKHNQNVFSIEFSALNYFHPERTRFRYRLEGFNTGWIETDARNRSATYTNLNPGTYVFHVKAAASDGSWDNEETRLVLEVIPPFYATWWAYAGYFILFVLLVILLTFTIRRRAEMRFLRKQEHHEFERMRDLDAMKTKFFTNVSHEFRTPLTLILTPLDKLLKQMTDEGVKAQLVMVQRNAKRLLNLVNQLLDFRKLEVDKIRFTSSYGDLIRFVREAFDSFTDLFENRQIAYAFESDLPAYMARFDRDKLEKIVFNLLSNAVKFTPDGGRISLEMGYSVPGQADHVAVFGSESYIEMRVRDTGIGISPDRLEKVFERFFQSQDNHSVINQGSGIGLSLTSEFVKMHGGTIHAESEPGKGSLFVVRLPLKEEEGTEAAEVAAIETMASPQSKPTILVIEDNEDLRFYLKENLQAKYHILEAGNGSIGWEMAMSALPQLIVSDIMMPGIDGLEFCRKVKQDERTSHIPVILLTARSSEAQKIEGLEAGAEDYITKPFNYEILDLKIQGLIGLRQSFRKAFAQKFEIKPGEIGITSLDEKFLKKALKVAEKNIGNSEFSVEKMGRELGVSRGHLYNKLLALTGKTPVEFIRIMRLKRAAQYLGKSQMTVAEIAFQVGFNDPKYFSRYFREAFGVVPSEYAKNHKSSDNQSDDS
jgi:signal transduction histidine kinase/ligand-binding sensor domain-containing protein/DNA-binding response OmpR family regulator